jgi:chromate transport protein ChrA
MYFMDQLVKADIFFFITTLAVVVSSIVLTVAFIFVIQILRDVRYVTKRVRSEADDIIADVHDARDFVKKEVKQALDIKEIVSGIMGMFKKKKRSRKSEKK